MTETEAQEPSPGVPVAAEAVETVETADAPIPYQKDIPSLSKVVGNEKIPSHFMQWPIKYFQAILERLWNVDVH